MNCNYCGAEMIIIEEDFLEAYKKGKCPKCRRKQEEGKEPK